jgi:hypothetical protein
MLTFNPRLPKSVPGISTENDIFTMASHGAAANIGLFESQRVANRLEIGCNELLERFTFPPGLLAFRSPLVGFGLERLRVTVRQSLSN